MKVYLAGPMRGIDLFNFPAFEEATSQLRKLGYEVTSPHEEEGKVDSLSTREAMAIDLPYVLDSDLVVTLPGWEKSKGALIECLVAQACDIPVTPLAIVLKQGDIRESVNL